MTGIDPKYFTPGPWIVAEQFLGVDEDGEEVTAPAIFQKADYDNEIDEPCPLVVGETNWGEIDNDLRLMALAPDMLAALKDALLNAVASGSNKLAETIRGIIARAEAQS